MRGRKVVRVGRGARCDSVGVDQFGLDAGDAEEGEAEFGGEGGPGGGEGGEGLVGDWGCGKGGGKRARKWGGESDVSV